MNIKKRLDWIKQRTPLTKLQLEYIEFQMVQLYKDLTPETKQGNSKTALTNSEVIDKCKQDLKDHDKTWDEYAKSDSNSKTEEAI